MISKKQLQLAKKISNALSKTNLFNYIMLDNWRGWCLIYDVKKPQSVWKKRALPQISKYEKYKLAQLKKATKEDKKLFGSNIYLNCRSLESYQRCYINWFMKKVNNENEAQQELNLLNGFKVLYSATGSKSRVERNFKNKVLKKVLSKSIIRKCYNHKQPL